MNCPSCGRLMEEGKLGVSYGRFWSIWWKGESGHTMKLRTGTPFRPHFEGHLCRECRAVTIFYGKKEEPFG